MTKTKFSKLASQFQAITPMCSFEMPEVLCNKKELYFRRHHAWMDKEITSMVKFCSRKWLKTVTA